MGFIIKKIIGYSLTPVPICLVLMAAGLVLLWRTKRQRLGKVLITVAFVLFLAFAYGVAGEPVIRALEQSYPPFDESTRVSAVVVLGGAHKDSDRVPATSCLGDASLVRLVEGIRIYRMQDDCTLVVSGHGVGAVMGQVALGLGVPEEDLVIEADARDTAAEAAFMRQFVGDRRFALVTSAYHMRRSMALFRKQGFDPVAAPAGYMFAGDRTIDVGTFFPGWKGIMRAERAHHELLGLVWSRFRGQI